MFNNNLINKRYSLINICTIATFIIFVVLCSIYKFSVSNIGFFISFYLLQILSHIAIGEFLKNKLYSNSLGKIISIQFILRIIYFYLELFFVNNINIINELKIDFYNNSWGNVFITIILLIIMLYYLKLHLKNKVTFHFLFSTFIFCYQIYIFEKIISKFPNNLDFTNYFNWDGTAITFSIIIASWIFLNYKIAISFYTINLKYKYILNIIAVGLFCLFAKIYYASILYFIILILLPKIFKFLFKNKWWQTIILSCTILLSFILLIFTAQKQENNKLKNIAFEINNTAYLINDSIIIKLNKVIKNSTENNTIYENTLKNLLIKKELNFLNIYTQNADNNFNLDSVWNKKSSATIEKDIRFFNQDNITYFIYKKDSLYILLYPKYFNTNYNLEPNISYALYENNNLVKYFGSEIFVRNLNNIDNKNIFKINSSTKVYIKSQHHEFRKYYTLFILINVTILLLSLISKLFNFSKKNISLYSELKKIYSSIRIKIALIIVTVFIIFSIILIPTIISYFINHYENDNKQKLESLAIKIEKDWNNEIKKFNIFDDLLQWYDEQNKKDLKKNIIELSNNYKTDIKIYEPNGNFGLSNISENQSKLDSQLFNKIIKDNVSEIYTIQEKQNEKYLFIYRSIFDSNGNLKAILSIPSTNSEKIIKNELGQLLNSIFLTIISLFIIAFILLLYATKLLTNRFKKLSQHLQTVELKGKNQPIKWSSNDELGQLVLAYNNMLSKLETNALLLAKNEREQAWKLMAQQVTHEIKNPLTPMKLNLQFLQKAIQEDRPNIQSLIKSTTENLIEQIENLNQIATNFGLYGTLEAEKRNDYFDVVKLISQLTTLHTNGTSIVKNIIAHPFSIFITANESQINRVFTNILKNAVQAINHNNGKIDITITQEQNWVTIIIKDNGIGINEEIKEKLFKPHFTTKSSGTGLGLAMCNNIINWHNGKISHYNNSNNIGASFEITLPVI